MSSSVVSLDSTEDSIEKREQRSIISPQKPTTNNRIYLKPSFSSSDEDDSFSLPRPRTKTLPLKKNTRPQNFQPKIYNVPRKPANQTKNSNISLKERNKPPAKENLNQVIRKNNSILYSSDFDSDSLRIRNVKYEYVVNDNPKKQINTIDTITDSDNSFDDIPSIDVAQKAKETDFNSRAKKNAPIEKPKQVESPRKRMLMKQYNNRKNKILDEQIERNDDAVVSTHSANSDKEQNSVITQNSENTDNEQNKNADPDDGINRTKYFYTSNRYEIVKKPTSKPKIDISISDSDLDEEEEYEEEKAEKEQKTVRKIPQDKPKIKKETEKHEIKEEEEEANEGSAETGNEFECGVTDKREIKRLSSFMRRLPKYKIPSDLIPYKMHTDTKMSFHGKKAKFTLFRGDVPLLTAKLKNKNGSDPIVNIYKYEQPLNEFSSKKGKSKKENKTKSSPIAVILTSLNFSAFSLRKMNMKSPEITDENDDFSSIHNKYGFGYSNEIMNVRYSMPKVDYAPRNVEVQFYNPPSEIPNQMSNRKPKFTSSSMCFIDIGGRVAKKSIKNCIMIDENNNERLSIMKIKGSEVEIESFPKIGEICVFTFGISSVLCKL